MPSVNDTLARHEDGVHRDYWTRPIYPLPSEPDAMSKCKACDVKVPGRPFTRMTRFIDVLDDKFSLEKWFQRQVLKGIVLKEHLILKASNGLNPQDPAKEKAALDEVCKEAADAAGSDDASDMGTELHHTIEKVLRGEKVLVPKAFRADVAAVVKTLADHKFTTSPDHLEISVVIDTVRPQKTSAGIGGKFDLLVTMDKPCPQCGRDRRIGDFKTGQMWYHGCYKKSPCGLKEDQCPRRVMYGVDKFCMQLAGYASAQAISPATGERFDLNVCQCWGYIIHVPAGKGTCEMFLADLERGRVGLAKALEVWQFRNTAGALTLVPNPQVEVETSTDPGSSGAAASAGGAPDEPDIHAERYGTTEAIYRLIDMAGDVESLRGLWRQFNGNGWTYGHELAAKRRLDEIKNKEPITTGGAQ